MVLFFIGLGLGDEKDVTIKGLEAIKSCKRLYLDAYTSILGVSNERLEELYGKEVIVGDRTLVEQEADKILKDSIDENIAFLVVGDPFGATTHTDLVLRAKQENIPVSIIHNASIMNAVGCCGLQLYNFGQTISIPYFTEKWRPYSFYDKIEQNSKIGLHTLCLLDIKVKEQTEENLIKGNKIFEPPRFMSVNEAIEQLLECEDQKKLGIATKETLGIGLARVGQEDQKMVAGTLEELVKIDWRKPLHILVLVGEMHLIEKEFVDDLMISK